MKTAATKSEKPARLPPESSPRVPVVETLPLEKLVTDAGTQVRSEISQDTVSAYAEALGRGERFPPVVVFRTKGTPLVLADGFHRVRAFKQAGHSEIQADVYEGGPEDALWYALGANRAHGQRLNGDDKRRAIEIAYQSWPDISQVRIASQVGCDQGYVSRVRAQLMTSHKLPDRVVGKDGRRRLATRPSRRRPPTTASIDDGAAPAKRSAPSPASADPDSVEERDLVLTPEEQTRTEAADSRPSAVPPATKGTPEPPPAPAQGERSGTGVTASQAARDLSNRIVSVVADTARNLTAQEDLIDFTALDRAQLPKWIADLEEARLLLGRFLRRLRDEVDNGVRSDPLPD